MSKYSSLDVIPNLTPIFVPDNSDTLEWGVDNIVAYATGFCVHLSHVNGEKMNKAYSIEFAPYNVSAIAMHKNKRMIAISDVAGRVFLHLFDSRTFVSKIVTRDTNESVTSLIWKDDLLLILYSSGRLIAVSRDPENSQKDDYTECFKHHWETFVSKEYNKISLDPFKEKYILVSSKADSFSLYEFQKNYMDYPPVPYFEKVTPTGGAICDIQWSIHLINYIFIVFSNEISLFHVDGQSLVHIYSKSSGSPYQNLVQLPNNQNKFIMIHKYGRITVLSSDKDYVFTRVKEFSIKSMSGKMISAVNSRVNDDHIVILYDVIGACLMDVDKNIIISFDTKYPSAVSSFDTDGTYYVFGTVDGYIVLGELYTERHLYRYSIGSSQVSFVKYDFSHRRIYWQDKDEIGYVDLSTRKVTKYKSKFSAVCNCYGSSKGAFLVKRDDRILGVFVEDRELPLITKDAIIDVSLDPNSSGRSNGTFLILTKPGEIYIYSYNKEKITLLNAYRASDESYPTASAIEGDIFAVFFADGFFSYYDHQTKESTSIPCRFTKVQDMLLMNSILYGIADEEYLFYVVNNEIRICHGRISKYCPITDYIVMIQTGEHVRNFCLDTRGYVSLRTKINPLPDEEYIIKQSPNRQLFSLESRDVLNVLDGNISMRLHNKLGLNNTKGQSFEEIKECLITRGTETTGMSAIINKILLNKYSDAADIISEPINDVSSLMIDTFMKTTLILIQEHGTCESIKSTLKSSAAILITSGKFEEALILYKIGGLEDYGIESFIECGRFDTAISLLQCINNKEEHIFKLGRVLYRDGRLRDSMLYFAASNHYIVILYILFKLNKFIECKHLKDILVEREKIADLSPKYAKYIDPDIPSAQELIQNIETKYNEISSKYNHETN